MWLFVANNRSLIIRLIGSLIKRVVMIEVVAGVIFINGQVLCLQRGQGKYDYISFKYEFPGGKVEADENHEEALRRELNEELDVDVVVGEKMLTTEHSYPDFSVRLHVYYCEMKGGQFRLKEHVAYRKLDRADLELLDWVEADRVIVNQLIRGAL